MQKLRFSFHSAFIDINKINSCMYLFNYLLVLLCSWFTSGDYDNNLIKLSEPEVCELFHRRAKFKLVENFAGQSEFVIRTLFSRLSFEALAGSL